MEGLDRYNPQQDDSKEVTHMNELKNESCLNCRLLWEDNHGKPVCCNDGLPLIKDLLGAKDVCEGWEAIPCFYSIATLALPQGFGGESN